MREITGKIAWVTGAGSGIGRAAALALAREGVRTIISGRRLEPLEETARLTAEIGPEAVPLPLDISQPTAVRGVHARIVEHVGNVDILVNNAGMNLKQRHYEDVGIEGWQQLININLNGPFYCVSAVLPAMRDRAEGLIINISSWSGRFDGYVAGPAYCAAKHAVLSMNATLNIEEGRHGIRACAICPEDVATPIMDKRPVPVSAEARAKMLQPEDLGEIIVMVAHMHPRVCVNEILINPTWCRSYMGEPSFFPPHPKT